MRTEKEILERIDLHKQAITKGGYDTELYYGIDNIPDDSAFILLIRELQWVLQGSDSNHNDKDEITRSDKGQDSTSS